MLKTTQTRNWRTKFLGSAKDIPNYVNKVTRVNRSQPGDQLVLFGIVAAAILADLRAAAVCHASRFWRPEVLANVNQAITRAGPA